MAALAASAPAAAQQQSADIELVRPYLSSRAPVGVDGMALEAPGTVRAGLFAWYTANPLVLEQVDADELKVIGNRATAQLVVSADVGDRVGLRANLPAAVSWGSTAPAYGADGFAVGDLTGGVRVAFLKTDTVAFGAHADMAVPTGVRDAWLGESGVRLGGGLGTTVDVADLSLSATVGAMARTPVDSEAQLRFGNQMYASAGARYALSEVVAAQGGFTGRFGFSPGTNAGEAMLGAQVAPSDTVALDLLVGHGVTNGVGATDARVVGGVTISRRPPPPAARPLPAVIDDFTVLPEEEDVEEDEAIAAIPPEPEWHPQELARVGRGQVELRDPINFAVGSDEILPESQGILEQVANILQTTPEIVHVVIVGHASNEGTFEVNYKLSLARAASVYEALLARGVHPDRLSVRAMGEVTPVGATEDEEAARRVEFRITRALGSGEARRSTATSTRCRSTASSARVEVAGDGPVVPRRRPRLGRARARAVRGGAAAGQELQHRPAGPRAAGRPVRPAVPVEPRRIRGSLAERRLLLRLRHLRVRDPDHGARRRRRRVRQRRGHHPRQRPLSVRDHPARLRQLPVRHQPRAGGR
ncbi:MAG: OmpA family protein [Myxococcota bacterium]